MEIKSLVDDSFQYSLQVFDELTIAFLNKLSRQLLTDKNYNRHPEIVALGFWLREANVKQMREENRAWLDSQLYSVNPLGQVFHVAPANVDTIFLYSICISLLMGNRNIVRISSARQSQVILFIIDCINKVLEEKGFGPIKNYINVITYPHDEDINLYLSTHANCRVIWGGDGTVSSFKKIQAAIHTKDILFPNRISYSVFGAKAYLELDKKKQHQVAYNFYNDAYTFDQLGCSSPRVIYVLGNDRDKEAFTKALYQNLSEVAETRYHEQAVMLSTQKYNHLVNDVIAGNNVEVLSANNAVYMVELENKALDLDDCVGGYFYVKHIKDIKEIGKDVPQSAQTLAHFGISEPELAELNNALFGKRMDRVVPVGQALAFHYIWDGMNLFEELSRKRYIK